jgi:hypothetical protein
MWRQYRADRLEAEVLAERDHLGADPRAPLGWDAARFAAVQRQQARLDRTLFKLIDALERCQPAQEEEEEPEPGQPEEMQNEPEQPVDRARESVDPVQNEPTLPSAPPDSAVVQPSPPVVSGAPDQGSGQTATRGIAGGAPHAAAPARPADAASTTLPTTDWPKGPPTARPWPEASQPSACFRQRSR